MSPSKDAPANSPFITHWVILILCLVCLGGGLGWLSYHEYQDITERQGERLRNQARVVAENLDRQLEAVYSALLGVRADLPAWIAENNWEAACRRLSGLSDAMPGVRALLILDAQGRVLASDRRELMGRNFSQRSYFQAVQRNPHAGLVYVSPPFKSVLGAYIITLAMMIPGPNGEFNGSISAGLNPEFFLTLLRSVRYAPDMWAAIAHGDGLQFLMEPSRPGMAGLNLAVPGSFFSRHMASGQVDSLMSGQVHATGETRIMALRTIRPGTVPLDKPLVLAVGRDLNVIYMSWRQEQQTRWTLFGLLALFSVIGMLYFQRRQSHYLAQARATQEALRESELWMRSTFHALDVAVLVSTPGRELLHCNETAVAMFGYGVDELRGRSVGMLHVDLEHYHQAQRKLEQGQDQEGVNRLELDMRRKDGQVFPAEVTSNLLRNDQGVILGNLSVVRDLTQRKRAEADLARWADIFRYAGWGVMVAGAQSQALEMMNPAFAQMHGYTMEELKGRQVMDIIAPASREQALANIQLVHETGHHTWESWHLRKDGSVFPVLLDSTAVKDPQGRVLYRVVNVQDISKLKQAEESIKILAKFPDESPNPILRVSSQGLITYLNPACRQSPLFSDCQLGQPLPERLSLCLEGGDDPIGHRQFEARMDDHHFLFSCVLIAESGETYYYGQDITARHQLENSQQMTGVVFANSIEAIVIADREGKVQLVNQAYTAITGYPAQEIIGRDIEVFHDEYLPPEFQEAIWEALTTKERWSGEYWSRRKDGAAYPQWLSLILVKDAQGELSHIVAMFYDITDIKSGQELIRHQAFHDALTGLPNRLLFLDRLSQVIARSDRDLQGLAVLFLDLDKFKAINDTLGHHAGDLLLQETARRLKSCLRESDTVSRLGGDEFTVLLPEAGQAAAALEVAQRLLGVMGEPFHIVGQELTVTTSIGVAIFPEHGADAETLLKSADQAMYQAKQQGRNRYQIFSPTPSA